MTVSPADIAHPTGDGLYLTADLLLVMILAGEFTKCVTGRGYSGHTAAVSELDPTGLCV